MAVMLAVPSFADDVKSLQNVKGSVSYQAPDKEVVPLSVNATIALSDRYYAITGASSLAQVNMPDSSEVMVGSDTKVQLAFFKMTDVANAKFVLYDGRVRFAVRHPQGAHANYTFTTASGTIAVRGTQGDVAYSADGLRVNVYEVCDPANPVQVYAGNRMYVVGAGQSLYAHVVDGVLRADVMQLTQQLIDQFSPEFGVPTSWDAAKGEVIGYAQGQVNGAVNAATNGYGNSVVPNLGGLFGKKSTPAPAAKRATCD